MVMNISILKKRQREKKKKKERKEEEEKMAPQEFKAGFWFVLDPCPPS